MTNKNDPYLAELDEIGEMEENTEEPTRLDVNIPSGEGEEVLAVPSPATHDLLALSPDIPVQVVAVLGRKSVSVKDLLELKSGSIVDLEKLPNEPVEILAAGKVVAKGELVTVDGRLGIRILKLLK